MKIGAQRCAVGVFCALVGALMLVAPHRLDMVPTVLADTSLTWWGIAHLAAGLALLTSTALPTPRRATMLAGLAAGLIMLLTASSMIAEARWSGLVASAGFALLLVVTFAPARRSEHDRALTVLAAVSALDGLIYLAWTSAPLSVLIGRPEAAGGADAAPALVGLGLLHLV